MRRGFLIDAISRINQSWWPLSSYGCHEAPLPAFKHITVAFTIFPYIVALVHTSPYVDLYDHYRRRTLAKVPRHSSFCPPLFSQTVR